MRRGLLLLAMVVLVIWLIYARPQEVQGELRFGWFYSRPVTAPPSSVPVPDPCEGCDPNEELACYDFGGFWDPNSCTCTYGCDPLLEQECYYEGGDWDSFSCTCTYYQCNPGPPQEVGETGVSYQYCDGWEVWDCSGTWRDYEQYCQDGSLYDSWTEYTEFCYGTGEACGYQCDFDPWACCDYWYCS